MLSASDDDDGGGAGAGAAAPQRWAAPRGGLDADGARARQRARAKLEEAKLSLAGSSAAIAPRQPPAGQSARGTSSQTKARLHEIQRKRAELMRKRQGVRNYNDTDD